ncbi:MAG: carbohydrate ABC transporter permease [Paenibacillaceae bacterium]
MRTRSVGERLFTIFNYFILSVFGMITIFPILHVIARSLSSAKAISSGKVFIYPLDVTLTNYYSVLQDVSVWHAFMISVIITVGGTFINLVLTSSMAYPLSRREYRGSSAVMLMVLFVLIFSAPLIPNYLLIRSLGMINTLWALVIPTAISAFNLFVMRSFFSSIPNELIESARIDGCSEARTLWSIVIPLSKPVMATMGLFYAVHHWNTYSAAIYYINNSSLYPLQVKLAQFVIKEDASITPVDDVLLTVSQEGIKMAVIVIAALPLIIVYPFLQRYFVKGLMIGSIKS